MNLKNNQNLQMLTGKNVLQREKSGSWEMIQRVEVSAMQALEPR